MKNATKKAQSKKTAGQKSDLGQDELLEQIQELTNVTKRALADLENFRRRSEQEKAEFARFANAKLFSELLPVLDNFERAMKHTPEDLKNNEWVKGITHIEKQLLETLQKLGLKKMPLAVGEKLDPARHEALLEGPGEKGAVVEELEAGYLLHNRVLKPARVKVGKGK